MSGTDAVETVRKVRQARLYHDRPVPPAVLDQLLEVARWTGSSRNSQPWEFVVVDDREALRRISQLRPTINWVADVPMAIAIVLNGGSAESEAYDEGRLTERLLIAANLLGLGGGTAWFGDEGQEAEGRAILGVPDGRTARSVVAIGYPTTTVDHRPNPNVPGRKPISELVSWGRLGQHERS